MPRISADTIADHVAQQEAAVLDAAVRLFLERGYHQVTLGDVAAEVGLARNSIYRYVPDKAHLLVAWYHRTVPAIVDQWRAATSGEGTALEHVQRWAVAYLEWAATPEHALVQPLTEALPSLDEPTRVAVHDEHVAMMSVVHDAVAAAGVPRGEVAATVDLIAGMVLGVARSEADPSRPDVRGRLLAAVAGALSG